VTGSETHAVVPPSPAGAYLRATAINQRAADLRLDYPSRVLFYRAFELAVRRRFGCDSPIADITRTVANAARRHPLVPLPALEAEMLIRHALGEAVPIEDIPLPTLVTTHVVVFAAICDELALVDDEIDALIATAEARAHTLAR
jgi:hypothetical protein